MIRLRSVRRVAWALVLGGALACSDARQPPQPASFDRPTDVDFVCVEGEHVAELERCDTTGADRALHALVTQSARGEVAAVNLRTDRILDNRRDVPGYTFVPTGELPVAIVVSREHPELAYVASYGSRDVRVMRTEVLLGLSSEQPNAQDPISLTVDADADAGSFGGTPSDMVITPDETALLITLSDVGKVARLPLNDDGSVDEAGIRFIELPVVSPPAPTPVVADDDYALVCGNYERPALPPIPAAAPPIASTVSRPAGLTIDRSCEGCGKGRVLVADEALPVLHVLDLATLDAGGDALLAPIPTGAPTRAVVATPRVPTAFPEGDELGTYFVYAIDAIDGSIMVLENDALLAINRDRGGRVDRLPVASRTGAPAPLALALEVITPAFAVGPDASDQEDPNQYIQLRNAPSGVAPDESLFCLDNTHGEITPRRLRGVFLSVALADGTVRFVDVHDMELKTCRSCASAGNPDAPVLVRHHPRLVADFIAAVETDREELKARATASVQIDRSLFNVRNSGSAATPLAPKLACIPCAEGFVQALPDPEDQTGEQGPSLADDDAGVAADAGIGEEDITICQQALVCSLDDPWAAQGTIYNASFEDILPNAGSGDGKLVKPGEPGNSGATGVLELISAVPFCARGVLGNDDIGGARAEAACSEGGAAKLTGDQLWITTEPLSDRALNALGRSPEEREMCGKMREIFDEDEDDTARLTLDIIAAFEDRLALQSQLSAPFGAFGVDELRTCLGDGFMRFQVRAQNDFLVATGNEGFLHNVIANSRGRCVVDAMSGPTQSRRAWTGCQYKDERIQFEFQPFVVEEDDVVQEPGNGKIALLAIEVDTTAEQLVTNASQLGFGVTTLVPARLRYSTVDQELYLVDTSQGGLIPIELDPVRDTPAISFY